MSGTHGEVKCDVHLQGRKTGSKMVIVTSGCKITFRINDAPSVTSLRLSHLLDKARQGRKKVLPDLMGKCMALSWLSSAAALKEGTSISHSEQLENKRARNAAVNALKRPCPFRV